MLSPPRKIMAAVKAQTSGSKGRKIPAMLISKARWQFFSSQNYFSLRYLWTGKTEGAPWITPSLALGSGIVMIVNWSVNIAVVNVAISRRSTVSQKSPTHISCKTNNSRSKNIASVQRSHFTHHIAQSNLPNASCKCGHTSKKHPSLWQAAVIYCNLGLFGSSPCSGGPSLH